MWIRQYALPVAGCLILKLRLTIQPWVTWFQFEVAWVSRRRLVPDILTCCVNGFKFEDNVGTIFGPNIFGSGGHLVTSATGRVASRELPGDGIGGGCPIGSGEPDDLFGLSGGFLDLAHDEISLFRVGPQPRKSIQVSFGLRSTSHIQGGVTLIRPAGGDLGNIPGIPWWILGARGGSPGCPCGSLIDPRAFMGSPCNSLFFLRTLRVARGVSSWGVLRVPPGPLRYIFWASRGPWRTPRFLRSRGTQGVTRNTLGPP